MKKLSTKKVLRRALKAGAAAEYLGISRRYLHDLTQQGRIPYHRIGTRCFCYSIADLDLFLENCKVGGGKMTDSKHIPQPLGTCICKDAEGADGNARTTH